MCMCWQHRGQFAVGMTIESGDVQRAEKVVLNFEAT